MATHSGHDWVQAQLPNDLLQRALEVTNDCPTNRDDNDAKKRGTEISLELSLAFLARHV